MAAANVHLEGEEGKWPAMQRSDQFYTTFRGKTGDNPNPKLLGKKQSKTPFDPSSSSTNIPVPPPTLHLTGGG
jgi:hypothetical protein